MPVTNASPRKLARTNAQGASRTAGPRTFELRDSSIKGIAALSLLLGPRPRDPAPQAARLGAQFVALNRAYLDQIGATIEQQYDGSSIDLVIRAGTTIGAIPLISPTTGRPDYGLVVKPRFDWSGLGVMLDEMGWRVVPSHLRLPMLPKSERNIPAWVLSAVVLSRVGALLERLERRFEVTEELRSAPRGSVDWTAYATRQIPRARLLDVPCRFPDLRDDRTLKAAIRFTLQKQLASLDGQRTAGVFVLRLIEICSLLLDKVRDVPPRMPDPREIDAWLRGPLKTDIFRAGLEAVQWTVDDRGLAGLSDLQGLPWSMPMESFFEAWAETVLDRTAIRIGGVVRTGRQRQTIASLSWEPPYLGSQKYLLPDLMLDRGDVTIIVDAKYKEHWEEMQERPWGQLEEELRDRHRADLLQVLAYANLASSRRIVVCLAYPCARETWASLEKRDRLFHRASLRAGDRQIELILTAFPMGVPADEVSLPFARRVAAIAT